MKEALQRSDAYRKGHNEMDDPDLDLELSSDAEAHGTNGTAMASVKLSSKKKEALSQVPCKFFRSNGCSAGSSCPFAHIGPGEGQGKAVCQWFLKGSCRFGHKCALAHILPGQPMSMDRKNKRAAHHQQQQGQLPTSNGHGPQQISQNQRQQPLQPPLHQPASSRGYDMPSSMLMGHTGIEDPSRTYMPTFPTQQSREGELLFGVPDDLQATTSTNPGRVSPPQQQAVAGTYGPDRRNHYANEQSVDLDSFVRHESRFESINRDSISTKAFGTSPFSHPGSQSVFYSNNLAAKGDGEGSRPMRQDAMLAKDIWRGDHIAREDDDAIGNDINEEDFLPSSLSDLLTPAELQRRSRVGLITGQSSSSALTPQSLPTRTVDLDQPWSVSYHQRLPHPRSVLSRDGAKNSSLGAREELGSPSARLATSPLPPPSHLHPGHSQLGISNTSAGFLTSQMRRGLASGQLDDDIEGSKGGAMDAYSPGAHAALSHAPGQSLPRGLASGLSSLHLRSDNYAGGGEGSVAESRDAQYRQVPSYQQRNGAVMGVYGRGHDELEPTAPSSIFAQRTPLHFNIARSMGIGGSVSASTSLEALHQQHSSNHATPLSTSMNGSGAVLSPYAQSPAHRTEEGIAIPPPSNTSIGGEASASSQSNSNINSSNKNTNSNQHVYSNKILNSSKHRLRNAGNVAGSPLTLPTTGEEVEEPIFELE